MNTFEIIILVIAVIAAIILFITNRKKAKRIEELKIDIRDYDRSALNNARVIDNLIASKNTLSQAFSRMEIDLLKTLRYITKEGQPANNVKVKLIRDDKGEIIGISPTVRRKVDGNWADVPVTINISRPI